MSAVGQKLLEYLITERKKAWDEWRMLNPRYGMILSSARIMRAQPELAAEILRYRELKGQYEALSDALQKIQLLALAEGIEIYLPTFLGPDPPRLPIIKFLEPPQ